MKSRVYKTNYKRMLENDSILFSSFSRMRKAKTKKIFNHSEYFAPIPIFMCVGTVNIKNMLLPALPVKIIRDNMIEVSIWPLEEKTREFGKIIFKNVDDFLAERIPPTKTVIFRLTTAGTWLLKSKGMYMSERHSKAKPVYFRKDTYPGLIS